MRKEALAAYSDHIHSCQDAAKDRYDQLITENKLEVDEYRVAHALLQRKTEVRLTVQHMWHLHEWESEDNALDEEMWRVVTAT